MNTYICRIWILDLVYGNGLVFGLVWYGWWCAMPTMVYGKRRLNWCEHPKYSISKSSCTMYETWNCVTTFTIFPFCLYLSISLFLPCSLFISLSIRINISNCLRLHQIKLERNEYLQIEILYVNMDDTPLPLLRQQWASKKDRPCNSKYVRWYANIIAYISHLPCSFLNRTDQDETEWLDCYNILYIIQVKICEWRYRKHI